MSSIFLNALRSALGRPCLAAVLFLALTLSLGGCDSCFGRRTLPAAPSTQSPATPAPGPIVQTPGTPAPPPDTEVPADAASPESAPAQPQEPAPPAEYDTALLQNIKSGMSYEEVRELLGNPGMVIAGTDQSNQVYRWSSSGLSFMGRFENGKLIRKNIISPEYGDQAPDSTTLQFDRDLFEMVQPGMNLEEVLTIIGMDAQPLTSGDASIKIYKWTDDNGSSITARFENGVLIRKSGMIVTSRTEEDKQTRSSSEPEGTASAEAPAEDTSANDAASEAPAEEDTAQASESGQLETDAEQPKSRVHVVGSARRERQLANDPDPNAGRSYKPKTELPDFKRKLRAGSYEIFIDNTTSSKARVAIIAGEYGVELSVPAGGRASTRVDRGTYQFYFIYDDDPFTLHQGQRIPIEDTLTDFVVYLFDDSSQVNML